jgi:hypothetical protein
MESSKTKNNEIKTNNIIKEINNLKKCYQCEYSGIYKNGMISFSCGYCKLKWCMKDYQKKYIENENMGLD